MIFGSFLQFTNTFIYFIAIIQLKINFKVN